jgi:hypothetical protein
MQDSTAIWIALIGAGSSVIASMASVVTAIKTHDRVQQTGIDVRELTKSTNGRMDKLLQVTGDSERAKGVLQGKAAEVARAKEEEHLP